MDSSGWDERYAAAELVWSAGPNATVEALVAPLEPGRAVDLAAGEGRNALWLAERGWQVLAVDFSPVAVERTARLADQRLGAARDRLRTEVADVRTWEPGRAAYDLVLVVFLQLPAPDRAQALRRAAAALAPAGRLLVLAHDRSNLTQGVGGPQDAAVLPTPEQILADLAHDDLVIERAEVIRRPVEVDGVVRYARDALVLARRPACG